MKKRITALLVSTLFLVPAAIGLAACNGGEDAEGTYNITVWVGEGTEDLTKQQIATFNETNTLGITFNAEVFGVSESVAAGDAIGNEDCADIFCFAQDQLARLVRYNALTAPGSNAVSEIKLRDDADSVAAATLGDTVWAFPLTSDNGYFMYYDTSVVPEADAGSLEKIIEDCKKSKKNFAMNLTETGGAWYGASFFYAVGCESEWPTDSSGKFTQDYHDTIDLEHGEIAAKGMKKLFDSGIYLSSDKASSFSAGIPSAVVVSGIWDYNTAKAALGSNFGVAPLPSFTVDGNSYQLKSYLGHKFMGVKPQTDAKRAAYLKQLALYLTGEECQLQRFNTVEWGPSNINAQKQEAVIASPALSVLARSNTIPQGQYPTNWWTSMTDLCLNIKNSGLDSLSVPFNTYQQSLPGLVTSIN